MKIMPNLFKFDIRIDRGTTFTKTFALKDSADAAFDLTGYTVQADAVDYPGQSVIGSTPLELSPTLSGTPYRWFSDAYSLSNKHSVNSRAH